ncbi:MULTISPECIES: ribosome maturation factor RimP [Lacticaseibacillus]|uniref:Ribosome maturation factor RimP n=2 Tax=Lacticaseibacillus zeae TaxID=57037 RepID=A0A5R8LZB9_LACZE|nr:MULTISPECIES: ribosome maturation factor RimP [Lacticaseibacillus]OFS01120.1 ribosome maturation factor [Lactobacillus sp. HMSC068F07]KLI76606.1 ribosome maturation protein RimP [Lacticaseibacillus casei]MDE3282533.1 ribosome maturation factor RimP [Lacticaseibacillus casei]MDE3315333.1 ribosome maturation factor RimP [Lacticaseibacillus zeae]OLS10182.1 ribosome maturation protein RimP [Lacticaseibacillus casei]
MSTQSVVETVTALVKPILDDHHFYLTDIEFVKEGGGWYLRVYIDKPGGITLDECVLVSEALSEKLDSMDPDPIPQQYFLEVSSPGAERPLKREMDYEQAVGDYIHVSLFKKLDGKKIFEGTLKDLKPDQLTLTVKDKSRKFDQVIDRKLIASARLAIEF